VIVSGNIPDPGVRCGQPPGSLLAAAIDVKWSKNYRIRGGNVPFWYSVVWLALPGNGVGADLDVARFWYTCAYVETSHETADLVARADRAFDCVLRRPRRPRRRTRRLHRSAHTRQGCQLGAGTQLVLSAQTQAT